MASVISWRSINSNMIISKKRMVNKNCRLVILKSKWQKLDRLSVLSSKSQKIDQRHMNQEYRFTDVDLLIRAQGLKIGILAEVWTIKYI